MQTIHWQRFKNKTLLFMKNNKDMTFFPHESNAQFFLHSFIPKSPPLIYSVPHPSPELIRNLSEIFPKAAGGFKPTESSLFCTALSLHTSNQELRPQHTNSAWVFQNGVNHYVINRTFPGAFPGFECPESEEEWREVERR